MPPMPKKRVDSEIGLAINISDLMRIDPSIRPMLLAGKVNLKDVIRTNPDVIDETAVGFSCDTLTAATLIDVIRSHDRESGDYPTRAYIRRRTSWERIPGNAVLTAVLDGKVILHPEIFRDVAPPLIAPATLSKPVIIGRAIS